MAEYFDLPERYPELFAQLNDKQKRGITQTLASAWLEGYTQSREEVAQLIDLELGRITFEEYKQKTLDRIASRRNLEESE